MMWNMGPLPWGFVSERWTTVPKIRVTTSALLGVTFIAAGVGALGYCRIPPPR